MDRYTLRAKKLAERLAAQDQDLDAIEDNPHLCNAIEHNIRTLAKLKYREASAQKIQDRVADSITDFSGSMGFVYLHIALFAGWIFYNTLPHLRHIDPYPFNFLTMVVSLEAIFLSTFVLISQNRQGAQANKRAELDLHIGLLTEYETTRTLRMLHAIQKKLGIEDEDEELMQLEMSVTPQDVLGEIDRIELRTREAVRRMARNHAAQKHTPSSSSETKS